MSKGKMGKGWENYTHRFSHSLEETGQWEDNEFLSSPLQEFWLTTTLINGFHLPLLPSNPAAPQISTELQNENKIAWGAGASLPAGSIRNVPMIWEAVTVSWTIKCTPTIEADSHIAGTYGRGEIISPHEQLLVKVHRYISHSSHRPDAANWQWTHR